MKGKINLKTIIIFAILILVIVLSVLGVNVAKTFMSGAAADYEPQGLTAVPSVDGSTTTVSWTTDKSATASVFYGTNVASLLLMAEDSAATTDHNILLTNLRAGKTYYYKIVVGENVFDNQGAMFSFKTGGAAEVVVTPTVMPTVAPVVTLPAASSPSAVSTPIVSSPSVSPTATSSAVCDKTVDYNKDGVINSLDYLMCLRGKITVTPTKAASKI
ncbi:MAG: fibronectin type III domain-containing protein [Candidatus Shapirobacteria bacterium]|nr:fibronectin type III domain-containing protein [Candidatus Shapirobacteria bacterium]MDD3002252.1 fibronectin type III domain-containing protein [Candidatus Shapirobacteria bacterium]MDD4382743.1 fibronectin type III domain-containing protein [Candidatus Shapirobacteria bacterium]